MDFLSKLSEFYDCEEVVQSLIIHFNSVRKLWKYFFLLPFVKSVSTSNVYWSTLLWIIHQHILTLFIQFKRVPFKLPAQWNCNDVT